MLYTDSGLHASTWKEEERIKAVHSAFQPTVYGVRELNLKKICSGFL
jgi:hypothetical protein